MHCGKLLLAAFICIASCPQRLLVSQTPGELHRKIVVYPIISGSGRIDRLVKDRITVEGIQASVESLERLSGPRNVLLLLDVSSSTREKPGRKQNIFSTVRQFIPYCIAKDRLAFHLFGKKHRVLVPLGQNVVRIQAEVDRIAKEPELKLSEEFGGTTDFLHALEDVLADKESELRLGDAIVIVTDGELRFTDTGKLDRIQRELVRRGIRLFLLRPVELPPQKGSRPNARIVVFQTWSFEDEKSIVLPVGGAIVNPQGPPNLAYSPTMERPLDSEWISAAVQGLLSAIRNAYIVDLALHESPNKARKFELKYKGSPDTRGLHVQFLCPKWILPITE